MGQRRPVRMINLARPELGPSRQCRRTTRGQAWIQGAKNRPQSNMVCWTGQGNSCFALGDRCCGRTWRMWAMRQFLVKVDRRRKRNWGTCGRVEVIRAGGQVFAHQAS